MKRTALLFTALVTASLGIIFLRGLMTSARSPLDLVETVTNANDAGAGSLRQAIADVTPGGLIQFDASLDGSVIHLSTTLTINKDLTIDGTPHNITVSGDSDRNGSGDVRVFQVASGNAVTFTHLTIEKGRAPSPGSTSYGGGGIYNEGALTVIDCTFRNNVAPDQHGGAIISLYYATQTTVIDSHFYANSASLGGAIRNWGAEGLTVIGSEFYGNSASSTGGAIIAGASSGTTVIIAHSTIISNSAPIGGGIYVMGMGRTIISKTAILSNSASAAGGGIASGTQNQKTTISHSTIAYNSSEDLGGGIFNYNSANMEIFNSTISSNSANTGGGIENQPGADLTIINSTIAGNSAVSGGGIHNAIYSELHLLNNVIANSFGGGDCVNDDSGIDTNIRNLIEDGSCGAALSGDPLLGPLQDNGDSPKTHALLPGSPAIDAGDPTTCSSAPINNRDQRDTMRPIDGNGDGTAICDIGSYEFAPSLYYFPLVMCNYADFPLHIGDTILARQANYTGEVFYTVSLHIPATLPPGGHFYLSSQPDTVAEVLVDDEIAILSGDIEILTYDFSTSGLPQAAIIEIPRSTMEQLIGQTITVEYRDVYGSIVQASAIWLIWTQH